MRLFVCPIFNNVIWAIVRLWSKNAKYNFVKIIICTKKSLYFIVFVDFYPVIFTKMGSWCKMVFDRVPLKNMVLI